MKVTMLLADAAQAVEGKLYVLGGGWSVTGPDPSPMALALKFEVPWDRANERHHWELQLVDADGAKVLIPTDAGDQEVVVSGEIEVGRPPGLMAGTPLDVPAAINFGPLPLPPGRRYVWQLRVNGDMREEWQVAFVTRER
jgi:hypothetical protein